MSFLMEKLLILSMSLEKSRRKGSRALGKIFGILAVQYSEWMEKRLYSGKWDPVKRSKKRARRRKKR